MEEGTLASQRGATSAYILAGKYCSSGPGGEGCSTSGTGGHLTEQSGTYGIQHEEQQQPTRTGGCERDAAQESESPGPRSARAITQGQSISADPCHTKDTHTNDPPEYLGLQQISKSRSPRIERDVIGARECASGDL